MNSNPFAPMSSPSGAAEERMDLGTFIARHGIRLTYKELGARPARYQYGDDYAPGFRHYMATLHCGRRRMSVPFSMGPLADNISVARVLDSVAQDAYYADQARYFEDFCSDVGLDTDSRRAEKIYKACVKEADGLRRLLGDADFEFLLYKVERL